MKAITQYQACDGRVFATTQECEAHEEHIKFDKIVENYVKDVLQYDESYGEKIFETEETIKDFLRHCNFNKINLLM